MTRFLAVIVRAHIWVLVAGSLVAPDFATAAMNTASIAPSASRGIGNLGSAQVFSPTLQKAIHFNVYLPADYDLSERVRFPVIYLLHGRGDTMQAWLTVKTDLDAMIGSGQIPPVIAIMPDAPSNRRAGYYIDSLFAGRPGKVDLPAGEPVEAAFTTDLVNYVDKNYRTQASRNSRVIGGYSMGGYGAMRWVLAHPGLFGAAIVLSPAVYHPLPPGDSSTREFGAFGNGASLFDEEIYREKNYPATLRRFEARGLPVAVFIAVGDDEQAATRPEEAHHDLDYEAHALYNQMRRVPMVTAELRVVDGGHNWDTWRPTFIEGARYVFRYLKTKGDDGVSKPAR